MVCFAQRASDPLSQSVGGFRVQDFDFKVWGLGFRVEGLGFRVQGLGFLGVSGPSLGMRMQHTWGFMGS